VFLLATPKSQNRGMVTRNAYCLVSNYNIESGVLAKSRRARLQVIISIVALLGKGTTIIGGIFSKGGSGAVYAMAPLIQRRMTGPFPAKRA